RLPGSNLPELILRRAGGQPATVRAERGCGSRRHGQGALQIAGTGVPHLHERIMPGTGRCPMAIRADGNAIYYGMGVQNHRLRGRVLQVKNERLPFWLMRDCQMSAIQTEGRVTKHLASVEPERLPQVVGGRGWIACLFQGAQAYAA